jgi:hypothetical protein
MSSYDTGTGSYMAKVGTQDSIPYSLGYSSFDAYDKPRKYDSVKEAKELSEIVLKLINDNPISEYDQWEIERHVAYETTGVYNPDDLDKLLYRLEKGRLIQRNEYVRGGRFTYSNFYLYEFQYDKGEVEVAIKGLQEAIDNNDKKEAIYHIKHIPKVLFDDESLFFNCMTYDESWEWGAVVGEAVDKFELTKFMIKLVPNWLDIQ